MRILINLVPEARLLKLKQNRNKKVVTTIAVVLGIIVATVIGTLLFLIGTNRVISKSNEAAIENLKKEVEKSSAMEQEAATLQEHLASFKSLHESRLYVSEIFNQFGNTIQPDVQVKSFAVSPDYLVTISGIAKSQLAVATFNKAIEEYNVNYKAGTFKKYNGQIFSNVEITSTSPSDTEGQFPVSYSMTFKANEKVFSENKK